MKVYFDNAATTAVDPVVFEEMIPFLRENYGNPSSIHGYGRTTRAAIEKARKIVANGINASTGEIFFTSGGTESNNTILKCAVKDLGITDIITSKIEHHCVSDTIEELGKANKCRVHYVKLHPDGHIDLADLENILQSVAGKKMVSLMYANNEIGNLLDMETVSGLCQQNNSLFHSDSVQAICHFPIDLQNTKIDFMTGSAHKFHGPKGIGFMYINSLHSMDPFITGGSQERNMRAGTENVPGIIGLGKAMEIGLQEMKEQRDVIESLRDYMIGQLEETIEDVSFNGDYKGNYLYTVLNVSFPSTTKSSMLLFNLDIAGIAASGGSACSSGSTTGSHVLAELDLDQDRSSIRFSFSPNNSIEEIDYVISKLKEMFIVKAAVT